MVTPELFSIDQKILDLLDCIIQASKGMLETLDGYKVNEPMKRKLIIANQKIFAINSALRDIYDGVDL